MSSGCKDECEDLNCGPNGTCVDGTCECDQGYSGANCQTNVCDSGDCQNGTCDPVTGECVDCNNGTCDTVTGECNCDDGYEGEFCDVTVAAKFLGNWTPVSQSCDDPNASLGDFVLVQGNEPHQFLLTDNTMMDFAFANVDGDNFIIPPQAVAGATVEGSGMIMVDGTLSITLTLEVLGTIVVCSGVFEMQ